jgi:hypothetical protein
MKKNIILIFALLAFIFPVANGFGEDLSRSVMKIYGTSIEYDYFSPWQIKGHSSFEAHGCVIDTAKGYILTLSHPLLNSSYVEVSKLGNSRRYQASVTLLDYTTGLGIVTVKENGFFKDLAAPKLFDKKSKLSSPSIVKWDSQDILKTYSAEVLKTTIQSYEEFGVALFHEMTTSLDSGGNGEPVFQGGALVGLVAWFDSAKKTIKINSFETIGWFMKELAKTKYKGQPFFNIDATYLRGDENLKGYYGLAPTDTGIIVENIPVSSSGYATLKQEDVIVDINGQKIDDSGYCTTEYGKLNFLWLIGLKHYVDETLAMTVVRDKKKMQIKFPLVSSTKDSFLIPPEYYDSPPKYYIAGGLLFQELSKAYMQIWGDEWPKKGDKRLLQLINNEWANPSKDRKRIVILARVLPAKVNTGYHDSNNLVLVRAGGKKVSDLADLKSILSGLKDEFAVFEFTGDEKIVINRQDLFDSTVGILKQYGIPKQDNIGE